MPCCCAPTETAATSSSPPAAAAASPSAAHHAAGRPRCRRDAARTPERTVSPVSASQTTTLHDCVDESIPATSVTTTSFGLSEAIQPSAKLLG